MRIWHAIVASAAIGFVSNTAASAACESFSANIPIDGRHFEYSDVNKDGKVDPGDKIVGRDTLHDKDGKEIGRLFAVVSVEVDEAGEVTKFTDTQIYALPGGGIFAFGEIDRGRIDVKDFASESFSDNNMKPATLQVIGGTGGYAKASGTVVMSFTDGVGDIAVTVTCE
jgi:hypothetical protein